MRYSFVDKSTKTLYNVFRTPDTKNFCVKGVGTKYRLFMHVFCRALFLGGCGIFVCRKIKEMLWKHGWL